MVPHSAGAGEARGQTWKDRIEGPWNLDSLPDSRNPSEGSESGAAERRRMVSQPLHCCHAAQGAKAAWDAESGGRLVTGVAEATAGGSQPEAGEQRAALGREAKPTCARRWSGPAAAPASEGRDPSRPGARQPR